MINDNYKVNTYFEIEVDLSKEMHGIWIFSELKSVH